MESGIGTFQAARFYGSIPYTIPGDYIVMDQEFKAELYTRTNIEQIATSYETRKPVPGDGPDDETVYRDNPDEVERFGEIIRRLDFGDVWQLHKTSKRNYYPVSWGDRKRFSSPYYFVKPWYQITDAPVRLHRMIDDPDIGPAVVADLLENIFDIRRRLGDDPFIPSVAITNAAIPMPSLNLAGVIDVAELTITPRRGKSPRLDMSISLGPGDGYPAPYKSAPRPLIWGQAHYAWKSTPPRGTPRTKERPLWLSQTTMTFGISTPTKKYLTSPQCGTSTSTISTPRFTTRRRLRYRCWAAESSRLEDDERHVRRCPYPVHHCPIRCRRR